MKKYRKIVISLIIGMFLLGGCSVQDENEKTSASADAEVNDLEVVYSEVEEEWMAEIGESVEYITNDGKRIRFRVENAEFTKEFKRHMLGDVEKSYLDAYGVQYNENGHIQNEYSYIWLTLDIEPLSSDLEWNPMQFMIASLQEDNTVRQAMSSSFLCIDEVNVAEDAPKDIMFQTYKMGQITKVKLGFLIADSELSKKIGYLISESSGEMSLGENDRFIWLNER